MYMEYFKHPWLLRLKKVVWTIIPIFTIFPPLNLAKIEQVKNFNSNFSLRREIVGLHIIFKFILEGLASVSPVWGPLRTKILI